MPEAVLVSAVRTPVGRAPKALFPPPVPTTWPQLR